MNSNQLNTSPTSYLHHEMKSTPISSYFQTMKFTRPPSISEENLFIKNLSPNIHMNELNKLFKKFNFTRVYSFDSPINGVTHRVEFRSLNDVEKAYAILNNSNITEFNVQLQLSPDLENFNLFNNLSNYYIKISNLNSSNLIFKLYEVFREFGPILNLIQSLDSNQSIIGPCFIRYLQLDQAEKAIEMMNYKRFFKSKILVSMANFDELPEKYFTIDLPKTIDDPSPNFQPTRPISHNPHSQTISNINFIEPLPTSLPNPNFNPRRRHTRHQSLYVGSSNRSLGFNEVDGSHTLDDLAAIRVKSIEKLQNSLNNNFSRSYDQDDFQSMIQGAVRNNPMNSEFYPESQIINSGLSESLNNSLRLSIEHLKLIPAEEIDQIIDYLKQLGSKNIEILLKYPTVLKEKVLEAKALILFNNVEIPPQLLILQDAELFLNKLSELDKEDQKEEIGYKLYPILESLQVPDPSDICTKLLDQMTNASDMVHLMLRPNLLIPEINKLL